MSHYFKIKIHIFEKLVLNSHLPTVYICTGTPFFEKKGFFQLQNINPNSKKHEKIIIDKTLLYYRNNLTWHKQYKQLILTVVQVSRLLWSLKNPLVIISGIALIFSIRAETFPASSSDSKTGSFGNSELKRLLLFFTSG